MQYPKRLFKCPSCKNGALQWSDLHLGHVCECGEFMSQEEAHREFLIYQAEFDSHKKASEDNGTPMIMGDVFAFKFHKDFPERVLASRDGKPYDDGWKWNINRGEVPFLNAAD